MITAWAHLPNAIHIDRLVASSTSHDNIWSGSWNFPEKQSEELETAWSNAWSTIKNNCSNNLTLKVFEPAYSWPLRMAFTALIAYNDCGYMLDSDPGELELLAKFGDEKAILLLPACTRLSQEKETK